MKLIAATAAEAELGCFFHNEKMATELNFILWKMGWPHPPTEKICNDIMACLIVNNTIKFQRSHAVNMHYF